ncbi:hypothetical protein EDF78_12019 [Rahnella sp. BIGb0236]|uniref:hypothetical protein n=1 Tax=Rahnella sp. BIGb0236 TaxID=2485117 RepID=UPI00105E353C|nr:hypothetical protein [Rahnella sp. BIGb0236]TDS84815.1 hypothetical protein EDF78_12019 [Rahnella sp. BIGb0236]
MYTSEITTGSAGENRFEWNAAAEAAYWQQCEKIAYTDVSEITLTVFMDAIALMYPKDWQGDAHCESFKLAEMVCGDVTDIYAKIGERYFTFRDKATMLHEAIIRRITKEVLSKEETCQK